MRESQRTTETPVAFFMFNRPEKTERVFERIADAEPPELYVIADGPRSNVPEDEDLCEQTRAVVTGIDWDCRVHRNYADDNLGVFERVWTGIEWVFENEPEAIILEDDCLPHPDFFAFCDRMLEEYRGDERVMDIGGSNPLVTWKDGRQDYHFSYTGMLWGWATWQDAWGEYDPKMSLWADQEARERVQDVIADEDIWRYAKRVYNRTYRQRGTWDYQWGFARHVNSGLSVVPSRNLVSNIGYGEDSTHTESQGSPKAAVDTLSYSFPVKQRQTVAVDREYDRRYHELRRSVWDRYLPLRLARRAYYGLIKRKTGSLRGARAD